VTPPVAAFDRRLLVAAVVYAVWHHLGALPGGLGDVGDTRVVDWIDLATPFAVLGPAAWALSAADAGRRRWVLFGAGALLYANGAGIHLAANSVHNVAPSPVAHLWDETVGHAVWYAGAAVVIAVLGSVAVGRPVPPWWAVAPALAVGGTWTTNALGAGLAVPACLVALGLAGFAVRHRRTLAVAWAVAFLPAAALLAASGLA
jgi:hypothetical protein